MPYCLSTKGSEITGMYVSLKVCQTWCPIYFVYLSSSGWTAIATSPKRVSGLVVATTILSSKKTKIETNFLTNGLHTIW